MGVALALDAENPIAKDALPGPVGFIGAGKVGTALASLLHARGVHVAGVSSRSALSARTLAAAAALPPEAAVPIAETVARSALVFLTVPDDAVQPLCDYIAVQGWWRRGQGVVHCSGALPSGVLDSARAAGALAASFHPLQAFASIEDAQANMPGSAFGIEGDPALVAQLDKLALVLGGTPLHLTPEQKTLYHAAASIASNYMVVLAALSAQLLVDAGVAPDKGAALRYLMPLMRGTLHNLDELGLPKALTGPIARGDAGTVARHLEALGAVDPALAALYKALAEQAMPLAVQKGGLDAETVERLRAAIEGSGESRGNNGSNRSGTEQV